MARRNPSAGVWRINSAWIAQMLGEIGCECFPLSVNSEFFESGGGKTGNKFVRSGCIVL